MNNRFKYAPGLPGYGNKGDDGSTGIQGISTYVSLLSGITDAVTIGNKIAQNKVLQIADASLAGGRSYQEGDYFIDTNSRLYQVDFGETNNFTYTGLSISVGGIFTQSINTDTPPGYTRYSNFFDTEKYLVDNVYQDSGVANYTAYPTDIYSTLPKNFGRVEYVDITKNSYYPFDVWTIGDNTNDDYAIALTRESANNVWHWGNLDNVGTVRDVSLSLDFADIYTPGNITAAGDVTVQGTLNTSGTLGFDNLNLTGWLKVGTDASITSNFYVGGGARFNTDVSVNEDLYVGDDLNVSGDVSILGITRTGLIRTQSINPNGDISFISISSNRNITSNGGPLTVKAGNNSVIGAGPGLSLRSGESTSTNIFGEVSIGSVATSSGGKVYLVGEEIVVDVDSTLTFNGTTAGLSSGGGNDLRITGDIMMDGGNNRSIFAEETAFGRSLSVLAGNHNSGGNGGHLYLSGGSGATGGDTYVGYNGSGGVGNVYLYGGINYIEGTLDMQGNNIVDGNNGLFSGYLRVGDGTTGTPSLSFGNDTNTGIYKRASNDNEIAYSVNGTHAWSMYFDSASSSYALSSNGVGYIKPLDVNTSSPAADFAIAGGYNLGTGSGGDLILRAGTSISGTGGDLILRAGPSISGTNGKIIIGGTTTNTGVNIRSGEDVSILSNNDVNITSGDDVNILSNGTTWIDNNSTGEPTLQVDARTTERGIYIYNNSIAGNLRPMISFEVNGTTEGTIHWNDGLSSMEIGGGTWVIPSSASDKRMKTNIEEYHFDSTSILRKIKIKKFNFRKKDKNGEFTDEYNEKDEIGYIAQEVKDLVPNVISKFDNGYYGIYYEKFVPILHKAILEKDEEINDLKKEISTLKVEISEIKNMLLNN